MGLRCLLATGSVRTSVTKGIHLMPESIGKGIASYISALKPAAPKPVNREPVELISRREPGPTRSVEISISQEAMDRRKSERL